MRRGKSYLNGHPPEQKRKREKEKGSSFSRVPFSGPLLRAPSISSNQEVSLAERGRGGKKVWQFINIYPFWSGSLFCCDSNSNRLFGRGKAGPQKFSEQIMCVGTLHIMLRFLGKKKFESPLIHMPTYLGFYGTVHIWYCVLVQE